MDKLTIKQVKQVINGSFSSVYSKEDVLALLGKIELTTEEPTMIKDEQIDILVDEFVEAIKEEGVNLVEDFDVSVNVGYKEIELDSIDVCEHTVKEAAKNAVKEWLYKIQKDEDDCGC